MTQILSNNNTYKTYIHTFQYKIINRILNCKEKLKKWSLTDNNECNYCRKIDTIEHHLFECIENQIIITKIEKWLKLNLDITHKFTICEIIFGIQGKKERNFYIINYIILIFKLYVNKAKTNDEHITMLNYLLELKYRVEIRNIQNIDELDNITHENSWTQELADLL